MQVAKLYYVVYGKETTGCPTISVKSNTPLFRTYVDAAGYPFTW